MITVNLTKAKTIAHDVRRAKRAEEFAPLDEVIMKQIPGADATTAESSRADVRTKYATVQTNIDSATDVITLKTIIEGL
jgi:hypothetical protein